MSIEWERVEKGWKEIEERGIERGKVRGTKKRSGKERKEAQANERERENVK